MRQLILPTLTFAPANKTLDFTNVAGFDVRRLFKVTNEKSNIPIYLKDAPGRGYTALNGAILTLSYDTSAMAANDPLSVIYDDGFLPFNSGQADNLYALTAQRQQYFAEAAVGATVAASATIGGTSAKDAGTSPSRWKKFGALVASNQAGTLQILGSDDNQSFVTMQSVAISANVPISVSVPVCFRFNFAKFTNGSSAGVVTLRSWLEA